MLSTPSHRQVLQGIHRDQISQVIRLKLGLNRPNRPSPLKVVEGIFFVSLVFLQKRGRIHQEAPLVFVSRGKFTLGK